jgi:ABC-type bacteriocin/lantibiotic exporter with double-glycine peptidase domain
MLRRRYPCARQTGRSDCGTAALATIALHYWRPIGLLQLRDLVGTDRIGTNLRGLSQAAETLHFSAKRVKSSNEAADQGAAPAIAHVRTEGGRGHCLDRPDDAGPPSRARRTSPARWCRTPQAFASTTSCRV